MKEVMLNIQKLSVQDDLLKITSPTTSMNGSKHANATSAGIDTLMKSGKVTDGKNANNFDKVYQEQVAPKDQAKRQDTVNNNPADKELKGSGDTSTDNKKVDNESPKVSKNKKATSQISDDKSMEKSDNSISMQTDKTPDNSEQISVTGDNMLSFMQNQPVQVVNDSVNVADADGTENGTAITEISSLSSQAINMVLGNGYGKLSGKAGNPLPQSLQPEDNTSDTNVSPQLLALNSSGNNTVDSMSNPLSQLGSNSISNHLSELGSNGWMTTLSATASSLAADTAGTLSDSDNAMQTMDSLNLLESISNNSLAMQAQGANAAHGTQKSNMDNTQLLTQYTRVDVPVSDQKFADAVFDKVMWLSSNNQTSAEIHLNPAELGPLKVHVKMDENGGTIINFVTQHNDVKDALEANSSRLRAMMTDSGLNLADLNIANGNAGNQQPNKQEESSFKGTLLPENQNVQLIGATAINSQGKASSLSALDLYV